MSRLQVGELFNDRYEILSKLGEGGMGVVLETRDRVLDKIVAVTLLSRSVSEQAAMRFQMEARATAQLNHPNLVQVLDFGIAPDMKPYMVMEYLDGELFSSACKSGHLNVDQLIELFRDVCEGVRHAHQKKILHRDLKPSNIIVCRLDNGDYQAKVVDFGIAKHLQSDGGITAEGEIIGSPLYMAPEQGRGAEVDERSDVYALGCVMYEALAHRPPLKGATALETIAMHESTVPEPVSAATSMAVPDWLDSVIMKCLAKSPGDRFQSMTELLAALDAGPQAREEQSVSEPADKSGATGWRAAPVALLVTAIVLVGLTVWTFSLGKREIPPDCEKKKRDNVNALSGDGSKVSTSLEEKNSIRDGSDPPFGVRPSKYAPPTLIARCRDDSEVKLCNQFKNVEFIDFKYSPITGSGFKDLKGLDKVWKVRIGAGPIEDRYLRDLKRLPALRRLEIEQVDSLDGSGLKDLDGLRTLEIVKCALSDKMFDGIAVIATLEMLCLKDCSGLDAENLSKVKLLKKLKALEISDSYLDDDSLAGLENASLKELNLGQNSGITGRSIGILRSIHGLEVLKIRDCIGLSEEERLLLASRLGKNFKYKDDTEEIRLMQGHKK